MIRIGLIDVDSHRFPNLPLMKISAWHKAQGDSVEWYSAMFSGHMEKVYMSKVFSFTPDYDKYIDADEVQKGGSGYCIELENGMEVYRKEKDNELPQEIEHIYPDYSIYPDLTKDRAYGFLTRGCPRACQFCHVAPKEGRKSYRVAELGEFWRGQKEVVLCDPNVLACSDHLQIFRELKESGAMVEFNQGFDARLLNDDNIEAIKGIRFRKIHFAYDRMQEAGIVEKKLREFANKTPFNKDNGHVVVLILCNFDTSLEEDIYRIQFCRELKFSPYPMIYDKEHADPIYRHLQRWCNNYVFWKCKTFEEYRRAKG